jgi:DUF4097 and DUF4098 domain-containing protein YvlB
MKKLLYAALLLSMLTVTHAQENIAKANGSVRVTAAKPVGNVAATNGNVHLEDGAQAKNIETVNGGITIGRKATVGSIESVNGGVSLDAGARARSIETGNGPITLDHARVGGDLRTKSGDIEVGEQSTVKGGIVVEESGTDWFGKPRVPRIVIGPGAVVSGPLTFDRKVELFVSETAKVGHIKGATAIKFQGAAPSADRKVER